MSKPDWKDAPEWAQWLSCDHSGDWYWFTHKPVLNGHLWSNRDYRGYCECASMEDEELICHSWQETLERRP